MIETTFREYDCHDEDSEHDDYMSAEDYECREYYRNGWNESSYERQRF
jgi:hypothetical protein